MLRRFLLFLLIFGSVQAFAQHTAIKGNIKDNNGTPLPSVTISIEGLNRSAKSDSNGNYEFRRLQDGSYVLKFSIVGYSNETAKIELSKGNTAIKNVVLKELKTNLSQVEVFGKPNVQPKGMEAITRLPLKPSDQIQSISVISNIVIEEQGALTITDAARNVPGVTLFGSYGGVKESMSMRGFRGTPVLKNGVRMESQFQSAGGIVDMQGVESVQVLKGSAAITQGVITDIGNAGGVINVVTKTPQFEEKGEVGVRVGSWGQFRPTFDVQGTIDDKKTVALRVNGAYERTDNYRPVIKNDKVYLNPSLEWRANDKTTVILEGDYLNSNVTPVNSAVNLGTIGENKLYEIPRDQFAGLDVENTNVIMKSFSGRVNRKINDKLSLRLAYVTSDYENDATSSAITTVVKNTQNLRRRALSRSLRDDKNSTFQFDFVGQDVKTGSVNHTFQVGFDYRVSNTTTTSLGSVNIDTVDVFKPINNTLIKDVKFTAATPVLSYYTTYGIMAQDVITLNKYVKAILGLRYSDISGTRTLTTITEKNRNAWNPSVGIMLTPISNVNVFGSYTSSTSLRSAANLMNTGEEVGPSTTNQFEVGIKSDWLNNRLRFNFSYFDIKTGNLSNDEYIDGTNITTGYVFKAGDLRRKGFETELNGRVLPNLQVMIGYAYLDAQYQNSPSYVNGSAPMNAPKNTANAWVNYSFLGQLNGLSLSVGAYYVGKRPVNEWSSNPDGHGLSQPGVQPFDMPSYYTLNAQVGYKIKSFTIRGYLNNLTDEVGYNSYFRGGYINQIDPRNFAVAFSYKF
jgi:iron complex outermembrane receptor protein